MLYRGPCEGGPYHGKNLYHGSPQVKVAVRDNVVITWFGAPTKEISVYVYEFVNNRWTWHGPDGIELYGHRTPLKRDYVREGNWR